MISRSRRVYSYLKGKKAEDLFREVMLDRGHEVRESNKKDNIEKHIDFYVNNKGIDIKGNKTRDSIWLELKNVKGKEGWLKGEADFIVFYLVDLKAFSFYKRKDLLRFTKGIELRTSNKNEYLKIYTRRNRKDEIIRVKYAHIKYLEQQIIYYEKSRKP